MSSESASQLRDDAARMRAESVCPSWSKIMQDGYRRAADALEEKAARMERPWLYCVACQARRAMEAQAPHAELRGWGVKKPDGTLCTEVYAYERDARFAVADYPVGYEVVAVRLTAEGATAQEGESNG